MLSFCVNNFLQKYLTLKVWFKKVWKGTKAEEKGEIPSKAGTFLPLEQRFHRIETSKLI